MSRFHSPTSWNEPTNSDLGDSSKGPGDSSCDHDVASWSHEADSFCETGWDDAVGRSWGHVGHRNYFLPLHYEPNYRYPLIVWLHSDGFNENQVDHVMPHISVRNYIAAGVRGIRAADSIGHRFDWHNSPAAVVAAEQSVFRTVDEATEQFSVHPERVVLAGYGSGGTMAMRIAMRSPNRYAAAVSLGGSMPSGGSVLSNLSDLRQRGLPMLWLWGTEGPRFDDETLQSDIRLAMMIKARLEVRQYPGEDEMDTVALADVNEWIMRQVVADRSAVADQRWSTGPTAYSAN